MVVVVPQIPEKKPGDGSFVRISSKTLTEKARQTLQNIKAYKKHDTQRLIDRERQEILDQREKSRKSIWSKLFGYKEKPIPTDEEVLEIHKNKGAGTIWLPETFWIDFRYSKNEDVAYRLINAAKYAEELYVSTEDLQRLI